MLGCNTNGPANKPSSPDRVDVNRHMTGLATGTSLCPMFLHLYVQNGLGCPNNTASHQGRPLIAEVRDIAKDSSSFFAAHSLSHLFLASPSQDGADAVGWLRPVGAWSVLDDIPPLQAVLAPVFHDEGHMGAEVVVHLEGGVILVLSQGQHSLEMGVWCSRWAPGLTG